MLYILLYYIIIPVIIIIIIIIPVIIIIIIITNIFNYSIIDNVYSRSRHFFNPFKHLFSPYFGFISKKTLKNLKHIIFHNL